MTRKPKRLPAVSTESLQIGRDGEIRTHGLFHPKEARYQAAPRPVMVPSMSGNLYLSNGLDRAVDVICLGESKPYFRRLLTSSSLASSVLRRSRNCSARRRT